MLVATKRATTLGSSLAYWHWSKIHVRRHKKQSDAAPFLPWQHIIIDTGDGLLDLREDEEHGKCSTIFVGAAPSDVQYQQLTEYSAKFKVRPRRWSYSSSPPTGCRLFEYVLLLDKNGVASKQSSECDANQIPVLRVSEIRVPASSRFWLFNMAVPTCVLPPTEHTPAAFQAVCIADTPGSLFIE